MSSGIVRDALRSIEFAKDLSEDQLEKLESIATYTAFSEGAMIFRGGDDSQLVYLILEGEISLLTKVPGHGEVTILTLGPGQLLGWSSLFPPQEKTAGAQTRSATKAIAINARQLAALCNDDHDIGYEIMLRVARVISNRLVASRNLILDLFGPSTVNAEEKGIVGDLNDPRD